MINKCVHGVKYTVVGKVGVLEWKSQAGFLYSYNVGLLASSKECIKVIVEQVN